MVPAQSHKCATQSYLNTHGEGRTFWRLIHKEGQKKGVGTQRKPWHLPREVRIITSSTWVFTRGQAPCAVYSTYIMYISQKTIQLAFLYLTAHQSLCTWARLSQFLFPEDGAQDNCQTEGESIFPSLDQQVYRYLTRLLYHWIQNKFRKRENEKETLLPGVVTL